MKLGLALEWAGAKIAVPVARVQLAERLGFDSVWSAEAYGSDAFTPLAFLAAHTQRIRLGTAVAQLAARTPAATAMAAQTLEGLAGRGRVVLGLGVSGPQIVEGWYGQPWGRPARRVRDTVAILRKIFAREAPVRHEGAEISLPYTGPGARGLGKPLRSILHGRADLPIYLAAVGPKNVALAAEIAEGWIPVFFSARRMPMFRQWLDDGFRAGARSAAAVRDFDIMPMVPVVVGDDVAACRASVKPRVALYVGGMGARGRNFYNDIACRYGYEEAAKKVQDLYLAGRKPEAEAAVPDALVDEVALCGPRERIRELVSEWRSSGVTTLMVAGDRLAARTMAELAL
jgi:F420-dependent oxidoreductase-like protein